MVINIRTLFAQSGHSWTNEELLQEVESFVLTEAKKHFGDNLNLEIRYDEEMGMIEVIKFITVVQSVADDDTQISLNEARSEYDAFARVGDEYARSLDTGFLETTLCRWFNAK